MPNHAIPTAVTTITATCNFAAAAITNYQAPNAFCFAMPGSTITAAAFANLIHPRPKSDFKIPLWFQDPMIFIIPLRHHHLRLRLRHRLLHPHPCSRPMVLKIPLQTPRVTLLSYPVAAATTIILASAMRSNARMLVQQSRRIVLACALMAYRILWMIPAKAFAPVTSAASQGSSLYFRPSLSSL